MAAGSTQSDRRQYNPGRPRLYSQVVQDAVLAARAQHPVDGPQMLYHRLRRAPQDYGLHPDDLPSSATIGRLLHVKGLSHQPVGPRDVRRYPDARPTEPGTITLDTWGPWHVRADRLYLATVQDRYTRLAAAAPALGKQQFAKDAAATPGLSTTTWATALMIARTWLCGALRRVYTDNGVGMVPAQGTLPLAARLALREGATLVYIPPAQPWRNGKLERWHWTLEYEYWRAERPASVEAGLDGLTTWLNYFNHDRPHSQLAFKAPAEAARWDKRLPESYWTGLDVPKVLPPQAGTIEAIRLVDNQGTVDTWGYTLPLTPLLAGQFVRLVFTVTGAVASGQVRYQQRKGLDILVATFEHTLDALGTPGRQHDLYRAVDMVEFAADVPANQRLDEEQWANQQSRTLKQRSRLEQRLAGDL